jgi:hypothetical protein
MHGTKIATPRRTRAWFAVIIGLDGRTRERRDFPNKGLAVRWIEKGGTASFKGKAERVELYDGRKVLMRSKHWRSSLVLIQYLTLSANNSLRSLLAMRCPQSTNIVRLRRPEA